MDKEIRCSCGKILLKISGDGKIKTWCKRCKKEVEIKIDIDPDKKEIERLKKWANEEMKISEIIESRKLRMRWSKLEVEPYEPNKKFT